MRHLKLLLIFMLFCANAETILIAQEHAPLSIIRLYTGADGMSHFERIAVRFPPTKGDSKNVQESEPSITSKSYIVRCAPGYFSDWHNADVRRYVITISGRAEVEVPGGQKFVGQPGEVILAEDLTGKGHTFRVLGDSDWEAMFIDMGK
jgi:quercetin dioxygenase-like cupin family protein